MAGRRGWNVSSKWVEALKRRESALDQEERVRRTCRPVIYRVSPRLRKLKPEHFDHTTISLGLFDLFDTKAGNQSDIPARRGDTIKMDVVIKFLADKLYDKKIIKKKLKKKFLADIGETPESWHSISEVVVGDTDRMTMLYDGHWGNDVLEEDIRSALALDAIFLASFLLCWFHCCPEFRLRTDEYFHSTNASTTSSLFQDIFKSENQIPLSLIKNVIEVRCRYYQTSANLSMRRWYNNSDDILSEICSASLEVWRDYFPSCQLPKEGIEYHHLLHCKALTMWNSAEASSSAASCQTHVEMTMPDGSIDIQPKFIVVVPTEGGLPDRKLPTAKELRQYGIKFEAQDAFFPRLERHHFFFWKATLFLPKISTFDASNEVLWRNLLAFEDAHDCNARVAGASSFRQYLQFMNQLIDDENDVLLLSTGPNPVIGMNLLADNVATANLFNSIMKGHTTIDDMQWASLKANISSFHNWPLRRHFAKFMGVYSDEPWLVVSLVGAVILLVLTFLQTFYAIKSS